MAEMTDRPTRRQFIGNVSRATVAAGTWSLAGCRDGSASLVRRAHVPARVAIARDEKLAKGTAVEHRPLIEQMLNAAVQKITEKATAEQAWASIFSPKDVVGIKVNCLGLATHPVVVDAIVAGLRMADVSPEKILIWDRFDVELSHAGFRINKSGNGVRCYGTDTAGYGSGYESQIEDVGQVGTCFSRIVSRTVTTLISVPVLKDHNLAGASLGMKNFFGAIHNPNKYHDHNCDPYVADVMSHRYVGPKMRLVVCDGTRAQYNAGPAKNPGFAWPFDGLIVGRDFVAADSVAAHLLDEQRKRSGLKALAQDKRPPRYIQTAARKGLGEADLAKIEQVQV